jgi:cell division protein FtsB
MPAPKKHFLRRILELRLFLVVNLFILCFLTLSFGREFFRDYQIQRDIEALQAEAEALETRNLEIAAYNSELQTEDFLESEARLRLGYAEPGEQLVVVVNPDETATDQNETYSELITHNSELAEFENVSNTQRWYYYFFDHQEFVKIKAYGR